MKKGTIYLTIASFIVNILYSKDHQLGDRGHQVTCKDQVGRPRACSKNYISMISVFALTNINTKIIEGKLSKIFT